MKLPRLIANICTVTLSVLLLSFCGKAEPDKKPDTKKDEPKTEAADTIRVMQFNILQSTSETAGHEWTAVRKAPCIAMLNDIKPDIVCIEEARKLQCQDLECLTQYRQILFPKDGIETNGGQRNLILYNKNKFDIVGWDKYWFSVDLTANGDRFGDSATTQKLTIFAKLRSKATGKVFWVWDTHFFANVNNVESRSKCVEISVSKIKENVPEDGTVFFCGDLNINYLDESMRALLKPLDEYMASAALRAKKTVGPSVCTYNKWGASTKVLDYIYYRNATPLVYKVVNSTTAYGTAYISDHFPIYLDVALPKDN